MVQEALRRSKKGNKASVKAIKAKAYQHAENLRPVVEALEQQGIVSLRWHRAALNERGMLTPRRGKWHKTSLRKLLLRLA
jgi:hypothetical protein